jgi:hypothetical protein
MSHPEFNMKVLARVHDWLREHPSPLS